jgi:hypothetical protein
MRTERCAVGEGEDMRVRVDAYITRIEWYGGSCLDAFGSWEDAISSVWEYVAQNWDDNAKYVIPSALCRLEADHGEDAFHESRHSEYTEGYEFKFDGGRVYVDLPEDQLLAIRLYFLASWGETYDIEWTAFMVDLDQSTVDSIVAARDRDRLLGGVDA